jgi:hypothetical protein
MHFSRTWVSAVALTAAAWTPTTAGTSTPDFVADSPLGLVRRFQAAYEARDLDGYASLFAADYRFYPSDPEVQARFPVWTRVDEIQSADHLFHGFVDAHGVYRAKATKISLDLSPGQDRVDPDHADSSAYYRCYVVPSVTLQIWTASGDYFIERQEHDFYVVRGDAAVLTEGQDGSPDSWYIRKWVENPEMQRPMVAQGDPDRASNP